MANNYLIHSGYDIIRYTTSHEFKEEGMNNNPLKGLWNDSQSLGSSGDVPRFPGDAPRFPAS